MDEDFREYEEGTSLKGIPTETVPPTNDLALFSFLTGLGGWAIFFVAICPLIQSAGALCVAPLAYVGWAAALFSGFLARGQIMKSQEGGADLARWGLLAGTSGVVLGTLLLVILLALFVLGVAGLGILGTINR